MEWLIIGYWAGATIVLGGAVLITWQTWEHRRFARSRVAAFNDDPIATRGRIALFVPCKGADADLVGNLRPLFEQDHEDYELCFTVESREDPGCQAIRWLMAQYPNLRARLVVAGVATIHGQKVHNLLAATERLPDVDILAFVDADVRPPRDWLRLLTQRLDHYQAATGYRWGVPKRPSLANFIVASIDSSIVPIMFPSLFPKVWGGSWAIRRELFEAGKMREAWQGTLSDDLVASTVLARLGERLSLEPACILPSALDFNLRSMFEFVQRQFIIGRYYSPVLWLTALSWNCATQTIFWGSLAAAAFGASTQAAWAWQPATVAAIYYCLHVVRAWIRQSTSRHYLPQYHDQLAATRRFDIWMGPIAALACCAAMLSSALGRRIVWRGIAYEMLWGGQIRAITRPTAGAASTDVAEIAAAARRKAA